MADHKKQKHSSSEYSEFQIVFEKLDEVRGTHKDLFQFQSERDGLSGSIEQIRKIVDSYSTPVVQTTFTKG